MYITINNIVDVNNCRTYVYHHSITGIRDTKNVLGTSTLTELGMDSLMGTDIKQVLEQDFNIELSAKEIRGLTFDILKKITPN